MAEIQFRLAGWEHECCGDARKVGDTITVNLSFDGTIQPTKEGDRIESIRDGRVLLIGETRESQAPQPGRLVTAGKVEFGFSGKESSDRVRCEGQLWEDRHGPDDSPIGRTSGRIVGIRWRPAIIEVTGPKVSKVVGYEDGSVIYNTEKRLGFPQPVSPQLANLLANPHLAKGPFTYKAVPSDKQPPPEAWAFLFTLEV